MQSVMCYLNPSMDIENPTETDNGYYKFPVKWIQINSYSDDILPAET